MTASAPMGHTASERDAVGDIDLAPGEQILLVTSRHWIVLIQRILVPFVCALICGLIAFYRAIGGTFLIDSAATAGEIDIVNTLLAIGLVGLLLAWLFT